MAGESGSENRVEFTGERHKQLVSGGDDCARTKLKSSGKVDALYSQFLFAAAAFAVGLDSGGNGCGEGAADEALVLLLLLLPQCALPRGLGVGAPCDVWG